MAGWYPRLKPAFCEEKEEVDEGNLGEELEVENGGEIVMGWGKINKLKIKTQEKTVIL